MNKGTHSSITIRRLQLPLTEEQVRELKTGEMVSLYGEIVVTAGLPTHQRILQCLETGQALPIDLTGAAMLHLGSYSQETNGKFEVLYINPTTSTRFNAYMPKFIRAFGLRLVGGKGGLDAENAKAMKEIGCVYLSFLGGSCTLLSSSIREIVSVGWEDLVSHYRLVKLRVEGLGPATVGIDAHGNSLFDDLQDEAERKLPEIMESLAKARQHQYPSQLKNN